MAEYWFDPEQVRVFGADEIEQRPEGATSPAALKLGSLLLTEEFQFQLGTFPTQEAERWSREDCVHLGKVALSAVQEEKDESYAITTEMLRRLYILGIGPELRAYFRQKRFRDMRDFKLSIGSPIGYSSRGYYEDWQVNTFVRKAEALETSLGRKPTTPEYAALAASGDLPGLSVLRKQVGGVRALNECLGYPDVRSWDKDRYIDFGADFIEVNGLDIFKKDSIDVLSGRRRGPGYSRIIVHFDDWESFKTQAIQRFEERALARQRKLHRYKGMIAAGTLPYEARSDDALLRRGARQMLVDSLLPHASQSRRFSISAHRSPKRIVREILTSRPALSPGEVEIEAEIMGVADDIWIPPNFKHKLAVTEEDLAEQGRKRRAKVQSWRDRKRAGLIGVVAIEQPQP